MNPIRHTIVTGDARRMKTIADGSTQLVVTSPPYWQLKDYGAEDQIGFGDSYEDYINNLNLVWSECHRILAPGCRLCVNIGDQFARSVYYGRYKVIPIRIEVIKFCEAAGFDYMGTIIWQKSTSSHTSGGATVMGSYPYPRNGIVRIDYESILIFRKTGPPNRQRVSDEIKEQSRLTKKEWSSYFSGHWRFAGERQTTHIAMFPPELPHRLIKMFSFVGETVVDPFIGSGTTALVARNLNRNCIGYEIHPDFRPLIEQRLSIGSSGLAVAFITEQHGPSFAEECGRRIAALPYIFRDSVRMERKIDPKTMAFGSKIDRAGAGQKKEPLYRVREVISPYKLLLSNGVTVRLIGIVPIAGKEAAAVASIRDWTQGRQLFMRFDQTRYDEEGNLCCYLYLANKTFINAHLIKAGLATADRQNEHRYLRRFIGYQKNSHPAH